MILQEKLTKKPPLFSLINRFIIFLFGFSLIIFTFYFCGQQKNFLDSNLHLMLRLTTITSCMLLLFLIFGIVFLVINIVRFKTVYYVKYIVMYVLFFFIALILCIGSVLLYSFTH